MRRRGRRGRFMMHAIRTRAMKAATAMESLLKTVAVTMTL